MTKDDIIRMAEKTCSNKPIHTDWNMDNPIYSFTIKDLERLANSIADHVREEDAMICIDYEADIYNADVVYEHIDACAERIRAMKGGGK